jgi:short-subunit dehydrogenase involved in D-alanine esterification of teichoic acids
MILTGNTIFITGGGSGIGRGLAEAFRKLGNKVIISGRRRANLDEVAAANPRMAAIELDITDPASINAVATRLIADHPRVQPVLPAIEDLQWADPTTLDVLRGIAECAALARSPIEPKETLPS